MEDISLDCSLPRPDTREVPLLLCHVFAPFLFVLAGQKPICETKRLLLLLVGPSIDAGLDEYSSRSRRSSCFCLLLPHRGLVAVPGRAAPLALQRTCRRLHLVDLGFQAPETARNYLPPALRVAARSSSLCHAGLLSLFTFLAKMLASLPARVLEVCCSRSSPPSSFGPSRPGPSFTLLRERPARPDPPGGAPDCAPWPIAPTHRKRRHLMPTRSGSKPPASPRGQPDR